MAATEVTESLTAPISGRIITLSGLQEIAKLVHDEYQQIGPSKRMCSFRCEIECFDDSAFQSAGIELFFNPAIYSTRRIKSVGINYSTYPDGKGPNYSIRLKLVHSNSSYDRSYVEVSSSDSNWANGIIRRIQKSLESFPPQSTFVRRHRRLASTLLGLCSLWATYKLMSICAWLSSAPSSPMSVMPGLAATPTPATEFIQLIARVPGLASVAEAIAVIIILIPGSIAFSYVAGSFVLDQLISELWPSVEFQIGPEHSIMERRRRKWIVGAFLILIVPFALQILANLISFGHI